jgi:hypothetical protein
MIVYGNAGEFGIDWCDLPCGGIALVLETTRVRRVHSQRSTTRSRLSGFRAILESVWGSSPGEIVARSDSACRMTACAHDEAARFVYTLAPSRSYLEKADFEAFLQDLIESFPGLHFLRDAPEFHSRYVQTVSLSLSLSDFFHRVGFR